MKKMMMIFGALRQVANVLLVIAAFMNIVTGDYSRAEFLLFLVVVNLLVDIKESLDKSVK